MKRTEIGMGMTQYVGDTYGYVGGIRSGSSPPNQTRLRYDVYDLRLLKKYQDEQEKAKIGKVEVFVEDGSGDVKGLVNIELTKNARGSGAGKKIIEDWLEASNGELEIHDIKKQAQGFWDKMGIEWTKGKSAGILRK